MLRSRAGRRRASATWRDIVSIACASAIEKAGRAPERKPDGLLRKRVRTPRRGRPAGRGTAGRDVTSARRRTGAPERSWPKASGSAGRIRSSSEPPRATVTTRGQVAGSWASRSLASSSEGTRSVVRVRPEAVVSATTQSARRSPESGRFVLGAGDREGDRTRRRASYRTANNSAVWKGNRQNPPIRMEGSPNSSNRPPVAPTTAAARAAACRTAAPSVLLRSPTPTSPDWSRCNCARARGRSRTRWSAVSPSAPPTCCGRNAGRRRTGPWPSKRAYVPVSRSPSGAPASP